MVLFRSPKTTFKRVLQNQVQIDFDNKYGDFCDENSNNFDDHSDENDQNRRIPWLFSQNIPLLGTTTW